MYTSLKPRRPTPRRLLTLLLPATFLFLPFLLFHYRLSSIQSFTLTTQQLTNHTHFHIYPFPPPYAQTPSPVIPNPDVPSLQVVLPGGHRSLHKACIVVPGGGYWDLAWWEGLPIAEWLSDLGVTAFVLHYRLGPKYIHPVQLHDIIRAVKYVNYHAEGWDLDGGVCVIGFSAGGHLSALAANWPRVAEGVGAWPGGGYEPDVIDERHAELFNIEHTMLIYPVTNLFTTYSPISALLGYDPSPSRDLLRSLSPTFHVSNSTNATPPSFVVHTEGDDIVPISNSEEYVEAMKRERLRVEFVRGSWGGHGFGLHAGWRRQGEEWIGKWGGLEERLRERRKVVPCLKTCTLCYFLGKCGR
ncbi:hypothetical protein HK097_005444 [Rhizophlyctis rosea]|uniref:BD-FAE-like domain-containing protein n=1 Tax=Rhizophlyctis rosea TaxID=64517 RepID=A0AAD5SEY4_9FUNG|nr:hypothetical protein HK097_005444 [Rhizophlyctis rosea]